ncbi:LPXTG cell wall anchor domain-containing protein [Streptococcus suis]|uniref:LPXTG cell wall anchor domain-containing protein n=1 Tax=Streptococcus suis TaxID=1307 RepID=UPI000C18EE80|nr:LPXTG cell wall anchor domain-containing protein [Streptococcus suis]
MQVKKFAKWGLALTSTLVLSGVVAQVGGNLVNNSTVVHAEEIQSRVAVHAGYYFNGELVFAAFDLEEFWVSPGESRSIVVPAVDGYVYEGKYLLSNRNGERLLQGSPSARYEDTVGSRFVDVILIYAPVDKPVDTPTEQPVEQPTEQPVATPADQPVEKPISVLIGAISEVDGPLSHYYVTINPGETKTVETPKVDGYKLDQYTSPTYELTYDNALKQLNSAGFAWVQFWMIKDAAPETPVEQPTEQPTEQPVEQPAEQPVEQPTEKPAETPTDKPAETPAEKPAETPTDKPADQPAEQPTEQPADQPAEQPTEQPADQPVEQPVEKPAEVPVEQPVETPAEVPVDTPTDKPVEQLTDASSLTDQTAGKVQAVTPTDKKTVDKSALSTPAVKPEEVSQPVAKTLPKTGDSSSMLLVLGGVLSGLSGLGLAATSRKRD